MLKILSGEKFSIADSSESIRFFAYRSVVFIAADGKPTFDGNPIKSGDGFYLRAGMRVSIGGNGICYKLEFGGNDSEGIINSFGTEQTALLSSSSSDTLIAIASALCDGGYVSRGNTFDEGAAKLLLSMLAPENSVQGAVEYGNQYVNRAIRYIERNYSQHIRVEEIARNLGIDRMYLRNLFTQHVGMSTMDYIMNVRMTHAKELLEEFDVSVSNVALAVGYADALCFSKAFKKFVGVSPSEYRENIIREKQRQSKKNQIPVFIL